MKAGDTTRNRIDTFKIISDDVCPGSGKIPVQGQSQDVLMILNSSAKGKVESMDFGSVCPGDISDVRLYQYRNFTNEPINIDTITILPNNFLVEGIVSQFNCYQNLLTKKHIYVSDLISLDHLQERQF